MAVRQRQAVPYRLDVQTFAAGNIERNHAVGFVLVGNVIRNWIYLIAFTEICIEISHFLSR
jgi:hypothetical protein